MNWLILASWLLPAAGFAGEISATVQDAAGKPVEDAVVFVYEVPGKTFPAPTEPAGQQRDRQPVDQRRPQEF